MRFCRKESRICQDFEAQFSKIHVPGDKNLKSRKLYGCGGYERRNKNKRGGESTGIKPGFAPSLHHPCPMSTLCLKKMTEH